jgi:hypothetical protein
VPEKKRKPKKPRRSQGVQVDPAATDNLIGFFAQLLVVDKRINPQDYQRAQDNDHV